jgi:serine/threonine protein kinase
MKITPEQLVQNLSDSGLMSADEASSLCEGLSTVRGPTDADTVIQELASTGKLTAYQAESVCRGETSGLVFGDYLVLDKIGQGGMGVVLRAQHRRMNRVVAVKKLPTAALDSEDAVKRFYREVEAAARLMHTNIVTAFDASEHDGVHYLIMEYVEGQDLAAILQQRGPLPVEEAVGYIVQAAQGLEFAHKRGVVHRDIKPANLLLDTEGTVKILDMGLARIAADAGAGEAPDQLTTSGQVMGTCDYMAPEQAEDTHAVDHRADIYSLGCTLYRLLTGEPLYSGSTLMQVLLAHRESEVQ